MIFLFLNFFSLLLDLPPNSWGTPVDPSCCTSVPWHTGWKSLLYGVPATVTHQNYQTYEMIYFINSNIWLPNFICFSFSVLYQYRFDCTKAILKTLFVNISQLLWSSEECTLIWDQSNMIETQLEAANWYTVTLSLLLLLCHAWFLRIPSLFST
jgi:hypothetical protein